MEDGLPIWRQCELVSVPRSSYYYRPMPESSLNLELMRIIDEQYMKTPFYGIPRMTAYLRSKGFHVNHKRVERLMSIMGIHAIYPKKRLSSASIRIFLRIWIYAILIKYGVLISPIFG